jgi:hypothetical protein
MHNERKAMTVTVTKIEKPKPPTNPLAFDPETQPGELLMCIEGFGKLMRGEVYTISKLDGDGLVSIKEVPDDSYFTSRFFNVHRLPDGRLAFGREPAAAKPERIYTTEEVCRSPKGSLFESTDPESPYTHARVTLNYVLVTHRDGQDSLLSVHGLPNAKWRRLATEHKVKIEYEEES